MFKTIFAVAVAACAIVFVLISAVPAFAFSVASPGGFLAFVAAALLVAILLFVLAPLLRHAGRHPLLVLACFGLAMTTSACAGLTGLTGLPGSSGAPSAAQDKLTSALADKLAHCGITGSMSLGFGGVAGTGTGFANTAQLSCPGLPYTAADIPSITPLNQVTPAILGQGGSFGGGGATAPLPAAPAPPK